MKYIEWNKENLEEYLSDKFQRRGVNVEEYLFLIDFIKQVNPETIIDVGCFYGISTYILGTSSKRIKNLFCIENIDSPSFVEYIRDGSPIPKSDYGKFRPKESILLTHGYEVELPPLLNQYPKSFVFLDAVKLADRVLDELLICYKGNARYVAVHDTCKRYKHPRRAVKYVINKKLFRLIGEICIEERPDIKVKGLTILERI